MECDRMHGCLPRSSQMIRCGLKHLKKFYELVCKEHNIPTKEAYEENNIEVMGGGNKGCWRSTAKYKMDVNSIRISPFNSDKGQWYSN